MTEIVGSNEEDFLEQHHWFSSAIYPVDKYEFLADAKEVAYEYLAVEKKNKKLDEIYPIWQTDNMFNDPRLKDLCDFIKLYSWKILKSQGYNMSQYEMVFNELWAQEHQEHSGHEYHMHGYFSQISGFFFLDVPKNPPKLIFHDPRPAKVYANLPEFNPSDATYGSVMINYPPEEGKMMFTNSWLPHTIQKNPSKEPFRLIHWNLAVNWVPPKKDSTNVEVV